MNTAAKAAAGKTVKVTLVKGLAGTKSDHRATVKGLDWGASTAAACCRTPPRSAG